MILVSGKDRTESPKRDGLVGGRTWSDSLATAQNFLIVGSRKEQKERAMICK